MVDAEKVMPRGLFALFERAQHAMTLLYSVSHATGYMRLHTDERKKWIMASEAERLVHELFCSTKLSKNGKPVLADHFFEVRGLHWIIVSFAFYYYIELD